MEWRRLAAGRPPAAPIALSEIRPSIRDFTQYLGAGRRGVAVVPLIMRRDPASAAPTPIDDLAGFAAAADDLEIAALAVATEPGAFAGTLDDLRVVAGAVGAPVLRYDCVADEQRLYESRCAGADAVLVPIAVAGDALPRLVGLARAIHVAVVAEIRDAAECAVALAAGAPVIAVPFAARALAAQIPARVPVLAGDGVESPDDLGYLCGVVDAVLVGRAIFAAADPVASLARFAAAAAEL
jgi:indole-3-glycerol phosphate synthase